MGFLFIWWLLFFLLICSFESSSSLKGAFGLACNWGTRSTHPLPPDIVVKLLKDNGFNKVKLFEADPGALMALGNSGIQVMLGIPNEFLLPLSSSVRVAEDWVAKNVSHFVSAYGTDIRYVAVGNEPFLNAYNGSFLQSTYPALQNVQAALIKAGLGRQVKVTIPLNADVYETDNGLPSGGNFRPNIRDLMISIINFLSINGCPLAINIYPFLSLNADPHFPKEYAYFNGNAAPVVDGSISYTNVLDANFDTLISALEKNGYGSMPVMIGEVGWPTDGDPNANIENARRFNQGLMERLIRRQGTPKRPTPIDTYIFAIIDEDAKSTQPGNFERHWGIFNYDGTIKYSMNMGNGRSLVAAKGVNYLPKRWCVMSPDASLTDPNLPNSLNYACTNADCTSLGFGSSCGQLDARSNVSYAFNSYFQTMNQRKDACQFSNLAVITSVDPTPPTQHECRFQIMIDTTVRKQHQLPGRTSPRTTSSKAAPTISCQYIRSFVFGLFMLIIFN